MLVATLEVSNDGQRQLPLQRDVLRKMEDTPELPEKEKRNFKNYVLYFERESIYLNTLPIHYFVIY